MEKYRVTNERSDRVAKMFRDAMASHSFSTQEELAEAADVTPSTVSYLTRAIGERVSFVAIAKLARALDIDLNEIAAALDLK